MKSVKISPLTFFLWTIFTFALSVGASMIIVSKGVSTAIGNLFSNRSTQQQEAKSTTETENLQTQCNPHSVHILDVDVNLPCDWEMTYVANEVKPLTKKELNNYVKQYAQSDDWPIAKKFTVKLAKGQTLLTFEKAYYFFPGGVGGVTLKIEGTPKVLYKTNNPKEIDLVRVQTSTNTYEYYPAKYWKNGQDGPGYYHIGLGNGPIKITLTNANSNTLSEVDSFVKEICITKKSQLCRIKP